jgi:hypothetical protein
MWSIFGLLGLLALVLLGGAWMAIRLMEEQERIDHVLAVLPPKDDDDDAWDRDLWWLVDRDEQK